MDIHEIIARENYIHQTAELVFHYLPDSQPFFQRWIGKDDASHQFFGMVEIFTQVHRFFGAVFLVLFLCAIGFIHVNHIIHEGGGIPPSFFDSRRMAEARSGESPSCRTGSPVSLIIIQAPV